jgi:Kef-type K+ transport system membrane component KefB
LTSLFWNLSQLKTSFRKFYNYANIEALNKCNTNIKIMEENIFLQISLLLAVTVSVAFLIRLLRQPLMVAYIVAGILCGPMFFNIVHGGKETFEAFAQFGVVLLLFILGLSLNFNYLKKIGRTALFAGIGQVLFTFIFGLFILLGLNFSFFSSLYLAVAITFSSTIIIIKLLNDKKDTETIYGRNTIGLMIVQDVIAIVLMLGIGIAKEPTALANSLLFLGIKAILLAIFFLIASKYILPKILKRVSDSGEFIFIFTITWCFLVASLVHMLGFSVEIGAIAAGLSLGSSPFQPEIISRIKPLRDFFIVIFFVILGSQMNFSNFDEIIMPGLILSLFILIGNPLILYLIFRFSKFTRRNSFLAGLTAAQVSEFGFVLLFVGQQSGQVGGNEISVFTIVALITIFISSYLITYNNKIYDFVSPIFRLFKKDKHRQREPSEKIYDVWIFGCHRMGIKTCKALQEQKINFAVVDINSHTVEKVKKMGIPAFFGDIADVEFLDSLSLKKSKMLILTTPDPHDQKTLISFVKREGENPIIVSNLHHYKHAEDLYAIGVDYVIMPHLLGGQWIEKMVRNKKWEDKLTFKKLRKNQIKAINVGF